MGKPAVVQAAPEDASFLLDPKNIPEPTYLHDKYLPFSGAFAGCVVSLLGNYQKRKPLYAGIHVTIAATLLGGALGYFIHVKNEEYFADRDAVLRHYVQLHPEDFKPKERIVIGDMLKPWYPSR